MEPADYRRTSLAARRRRRRAGTLQRHGRPDAGNLERLADLLETGALWVPIQRTCRLEQAGEALQALPATHTQGKLALTIA